MNAKIYSATTIGIDSHLIEVEADISNGMVNFFIVGLADKAIKESKERVRAALKNSGLELPMRLITINLAPAHIKKQQTLFDVPIAIAILQASRNICLKPKSLEETIFLGELSLSGDIKPVRGVLSMVHKAQIEGKARAIVPKGNIQEASAIEGIEVIGVSNLSELVGYLRDEKDIAPTKRFVKEETRKKATKSLDFSEVKGQRQAKRALQIAAAGHHNILFIGPPGAGKTMLAQRLSTIMPKLSFGQAIDVSKIYSIAGLLPDSQLVTKKPFRNPHHTVSNVGLVGGGSNPIPGEISLAHNGILFLDELTEFNRTAIETLRQPLENKNIIISRAGSTVEYPCNFLLIAALNPCPCGYFGDETKRCVCSPIQIQKYIGKLSGPLLDRIDLHVNISSVKYDDLSSNEPDEISSSIMKSKVEAATLMAQKRNQKNYNAGLSAEEVHKICKLSSQAEEIMQKYFKHLNMSARSYHKVLKLSRTIADLEQSEKIETIHIKEAIMYRSLDKGTK